MNGLKSILILAALFSFQVVNGQTLSDKEIYDIDQYLNQQVSGTVPGLAVGVVKGGKIMLERYLGFADLHHNIPVDTSTRFNIASTAKQFTALCILKLSLEDKLDLSDDFRKYLPTFFPERKDPIQIKTLLNHSSGIRDFYELISVQNETWWRMEGLGNDDALELLERQHNLNFPPGSEHSYSNSNYTILTKVVEEVSGQSFHEYSKNLFLSLGMYETDFQKNYMSIIPNLALPYSNWGNGKWSQYPHITNLYGDGFLYTTLTDQLIYERRLQTASRDELAIQSQKLVPGSEIDNYGFGLELNEKLGYPSINHSGSTGAYHSQILRFPEQELSIMVMSNNGNISSSSIANKIASLLLPAKSITKSVTPIASTGNIMDKKEILGEYISSKKSIIRILEDNGELYWKKDNNNPIKLALRDGNVFKWVENSEVELLFSEVEFQLFYKNELLRSYTKLPDFNVSNEYQNALEGQYKSSELDVAFNLEVNDRGQLMFTRSGEDDSYEVEIIQKDHLLLSNYKIHVKRDAFSRVAALLVDYGDINNLMFKKVDDGIYQPQIKLLVGSIQVTTIGSLKNKDQILLTRNDEEGNEIWAKQFGSKGWDRASSIIQTIDGGFLIIGSTSSYGKGNYDVWIIKTDQHGKEIWNRVYGEFYNEYGYFATQNSDGTYLIKATKQTCVDMKTG